jgi:hypothetical protein
MTARIALLLSLAVAAVAGCSNSSGGSNNTASTPPVVTPTSTSSATASATASPSPTPTPSFSSTVQASHRCATGQLRLSLGQSQGAAGSTFTPIVFTNASKHACTLYGYPGVSFLDSTGAQVGVDATHDGGEEATVTLAPGQAANAQLQLPDPGVAQCQTAKAATLRVYPPGDFTALSVADPVTICKSAKGAANVHPVTPGAG